MSTEITVQPTSAIIAIRGEEVQVSASTPEEMTHAQSALIEWCRRKIATLQQEAHELKCARDEAKQRKWKHTTLAAHALLAERRVVFYQKMQSALEHGFIIVPNFPVQLFAIRTDKEEPRGASRHHRSDFEQPAETLPPGEGEYKNPFPEVWLKDYSSSLPEADRKAGKRLIEYYANKWKELEFPVTMAKPHIMQACGRAMALKLFDDLGILPAQHRNRDPMIVARLKDPRSTKYNRKFISFIVAWHLDTSVL